MRAAKYTDGPNEDGYYTAGIDVPIINWCGRPDWHYHAIEFHHKDKTRTEYLRDVALARLRETFE